MLSRKNISNAVMGCIVAGAVVTSSYLAYGTVDYARKFNILSEIDSAVDVDGDYNATTSEWGIVYNTLGVQNTGKKGVDLELGQLEKYLEIKESD